MAIGGEPLFKKSRQTKETKGEEETHAKELAPEIISLVKKDFENFIDKVKKNIKKAENAYPFKRGGNACLYIPSLEDKVWLHSIKINSSIIKIPWFGGVAGSSSPEPYGKPLDYFNIINEPDELEKFLNSELKNYTRGYGVESVISSVEEEETAKYPAWLFRNSQNTEFKKKFIEKLNLLLEQELKKEPLSEDQILDNLVKEMREMEFENSKKAITLWKKSRNEPGGEWFYKDPHKNFWSTREALDEKIITEEESRKIVDLLERKDWNIQEIPVEVINRLTDIRMISREKFDREKLAPGEYAKQFRKICSIINTFIRCKLSEKELSEVAKVIKDNIETTKMLPNAELSLGTFYDTRVNPYSLVQQLINL